jgi:hypothetical protein
MEGAQENSPGLTPGVTIRKLESPEGATLKPICRIDCAAPSGLDIDFTVPPGFMPGAIFCRPSGPKFRVSRQKLARASGDSQFIEQPSNKVEQPTSAITLPMSQIRDMMDEMKPVDFHPRALEFIRAQPPSIRRQVGEALRDLQKGVSLGMPLSRPMTAIAPGVSELRVRGEGATVRAFYFVRKTAA